MRPLLLFIETGSDFELSRRRPVLRIFALIIKSFYCHSEAVKRRRRRLKKPSLAVFKIVASFPTNLFSLSRLFQKARDGFGEQRFSSEKIFCPVTHRRREGCHTVKQPFAKEERRMELPPEFSGAGI